MSTCRKVILLILGVIAVYIGVQVNRIFEIPPLPELKDEWWGPGKPHNQSTAITPFQIGISDKVMEDFTHRLKNSRRFVKPLEGIQQQYGMNTNLLIEIVEFWKTEYNWREREKFLNQYRQFTTNIQGLKIHFLHIKPTITNGLRVLPLLMLHGWPGSIREFYEIIPLLTVPQKGRYFVFEIIAPSLPGFGFSDGASKSGLGPVEMAVVFMNLMERLGYEKYYIQGGDWGAIIVSFMGRLYPNKILGIHSNICMLNSPVAALELLIGSIYPPLIVEKKFEHKLYPLSDIFSHILLEFGYLHLQSTKPDTLGVGLNDSPVGLAAYILEKFTSWTKFEWQSRQDGGLTEKFSYTNLLDNIMIYWVTNTITTSARIYAETFNNKLASLQILRIPIKVPSACANFENELFYYPENLLKHTYKNLTQFTHIADGGHFAAFEVPNLLANDIWNAVENFDRFYK